MRPKPGKTAILVKFKPLPPQIVSRAKRAVARQENKGFLGENNLYRALGRAKNIDPRAGTLEWVEPNTSDRMPAGCRVREINVSRNYPSARLVVKVLDWPVLAPGEKRPTAAQFVELLKRKVADHNARYKKEDYLLLAPPVHAIGEELIAMPWIMAPTIEDLFPPEGKAREAQDTVFLERLKKLTGVSEERIRTASEKVSKRTRSYPHNVWLLGVKRGKPVFMLPCDLN